MLAVAPLTLFADQEVREPYTKASQDGLFDELTKIAESVPLLALERVTLLESEAQRDRILRLGFTSALIRQRDVAETYLPTVIDRPWIGEISFPNACALAKMLDNETSAAAAEKLLWKIARKNPDVALRETEGYLDLSFGPRLFDRAVRAAPDEALAIASGTSVHAARFRDALKASEAPEIRLLADLSEDHSIDAPRLRRVALLHKRIARGELSLRAAAQIAGNFSRYFATLADIRISGKPEDAGPLDRALENESLVFCQAFQEGEGRVLAGDLAGFTRAISTCCWPTAAPNPTSRSSARHSIICSFPSCEPAPRAAPSSRSSIRPATSSSATSWPRRWRCTASMHSWKSPAPR